MGAESGFPYVAGVALLVSSALLSALVLGYALYSCWRFYVKRKYEIVA